MHPIERLRYVARAGDVDSGLLVRETAGALASLGVDPPGLVTACRRLLDRHPASGPLWSLAARLLTAPDPLAEAWRVAEQMEDDPTPRELGLALPEEATVTVVGWPEQVARALPRRGDLEVLVVDAGGAGSGLVRRLLGADVEAVDVPRSGLGAAAAESDVVLLEAVALGPDGFVATAGSRAAAAVARHAGGEVWLAAGVGRALPGPLWTALRSRLDRDEPWEGEVEVVPLDLADRAVGPDGEGPAGRLARRADCPVAPELLKDVE